MGRKKRQEIVEMGWRDKEAKWHYLNRKNDIVRWKEMSHGTKGEESILEAGM